MIAKLLVVWAFSLQLALGDISVRVGAGRINGTVRTFEGKEVRQYLGIPFAQPPIGDKRFKKPERLEVQKDVSGDQWAPRCVQGGPPSNVSMSEDCLQLNIWTPKSDG